MRSATMRNAGLPVVLAIMLGILWPALATVHDGRSFAIEAALPELEKKIRPFKLRDAWWEGNLAAGKTKLIRHQLFNRNEYWFWIGSSDEDAEVSIHVYDKKGKLVEEESWQKGNVAGARVLPKATGSYFIRIKVISASAPVEWAVIYGYR